ncbi:hypothetical protein ACI3L1_01115 [Deinococcus sp. SM5_A1]|uniref:hypothetical protein n=1 Tax=Deinococcus sp. SM5_A1 TaxID=3379094 RepID=UPI0038586064
MTPSLPLEHLPRLKEWQRETDDGVSLSDLIGVEGNPELAVAFADLSWPTFIEVDGCIIRQGAYTSERFDRWMETTGRNCTQVEQMLNHIHTTYLLPNSPQYSSAIYEYLAGVIRSGWNAASAAQFPDRKFVILCETEPDDYGPTIYFWQDRPDDQGVAK